MTYSITEGRIVTGNADDVRGSLIGLGIEDSSLAIPRKVIHHITLDNTLIGVFLYYQIYEYLVIIKRWVIFSLTLSLTVKLPSVL